MLELSTRNRLLNIPTSARAKVVRIVDEKSEEIYRMLVRESKAFRFLAAPVDHAEDDEEFSLEENGFDQPEEEEGPRARHKDTKLQTRLSSKKLQNRLLSLHVDARTYMEEQGVNILYLAMGQLKWFEDENSDTPRLAPLLLVSVRLERSSAASQFKLRAMEEDPSVNLTLHARLEEFGIRLPTVEIDEDFSPGDYFDQVAERVEGVKGWEVFPDAMVLGFFSFSKFLMYRDLDGENWPEGSAIEQNELVKSLMLEGFSSEGDRIDETGHLDQLIPVERLNHVIDADSSQSVAIEEVRKGHNLIIQGPPGTGKSQTITNLIATAVLDGKKVLFVAEKMAALQVVHRRLQEIGLGPTAVELHSHKTNKKAFLEELGKTLKEPRPVCEDRDRRIERLETIRERLNRHADCLNQMLEPSSLTPFQIIGHLAYLSNDESDTPAKPLAGAVNWTPDERMARENTIRLIGERLDQIGPVQSHPWYGVRAEAMSKFQLDAIDELVRQTQALFEPHAAAAERLWEILQVPARESHRDLEHAYQLGESVLRAPLHDPSCVEHSFWDLPLDEGKQIVESVEAFQKGKAELEAMVIPDALSVDWGETRQKIAAHGGSFFRFLNGEYRRALAHLRGLLKNPKELPGSLEERLHLIDTCLEVQESRAAIEEWENQGKAAFGCYWEGADSDPAVLREWTTFLGDFEDKHLQCAVRRVLAMDLPKEDLAGRLRESQRAGESFYGSWEQLRGRLSLDDASAFAVENPDEVTLNQMRNVLEKWVQSKESLSTWIQYWNLSEEGRRYGLPDLIDAIEAGAYTEEEAVRLFQRSCYRALYDFVMQQYPELKTFDGQTHAGLIEEFRKMDHERIELARIEVLAAHADGKPSAHHGRGMLGIVLGEIAKKRRHMAIRRLIGCAGEAIQAIKPVFMMSPLSAAQFLEPGKISFDLVIFDEASQVKPVDALGAIARGRQVVVVGDNQQLPPSNFFSRVELSDDAFEEEEEALAAAGDMESVLSLSGARGLPNRMLRWHYRSRHSSLIAVSNHEFYGNELFIVPSPLSEHADFGLKFQYVADGVYNRGGRRQDNKVEARKVAECVMQHARENAGQSLGVAAFSVSQRDAILDELELLRRENPDLETFFGAAHPHEPFFVKNLENVQGDERDVILISVGYGADASGYLAMNFGPINRDGGERRLNVLISRAKFKCVVFSSIRSDEIDLGRSRGKGVRALKTFLQYAETGILGTARTDTGRGPDSPFEMAVQRALEDEGYQVYSQIGVAGFFIDLAVVDPEQPGRFLLGVECDGASYHSSRSARERDRQRQMVLEDHGWTLHRIWSTDWFLRPQEELAKTIRAIERAKVLQISPTSGEEESGGQNRLPVNWVEEPSDEASASITPLYEEYRCDPPGVELTEASVTVLKGYVKAIVAVEGPIYAEELVSRMKRIFGLGRAGRLVQESIDKAIGAACRARTVKRKHDFLALPDQVVHARDRSEVESNTLKKPERIAGEEIQAAVQLAIENYHGVAREEMASVVARLLGIRRTTPGMEKAVKAAVGKLLRSGAIQEMDGYLR